MSLTASIKYFDGLQMELHPGDIISDCIHAHGVWEEALSQRLLAIARDSGGLLVDVGANLGYFSLLWAKSRADNQVLAFEASPRIYPKLFRNVALNGLDRQISSLPTALGDRLGVLDFVLGPEKQTGWGGLLNDPNQASCKVVCTRLDELAPDAHIRVLKIDVEGADTLVLKGCEQLLRRRQIDEIVYEQNAPRMSRLGIEPGEARTYLESLGYAVEPIAEPDAAVSEWRAVPG